MSTLLDPGAFTTEPGFKVPDVDWRYLPMVFARAVLLSAPAALRAVEAVGADIFTEDVFTEDAPDAFADASTASNAANETIFVLMLLISKPLFLQIFNLQLLFQTAIAHPNANTPRCKKHPARASRGEEKIDVGNKGFSR